MTGAASVVVAALFLLHSRRAPDPIINVRLFASRRFSVGIASGLVSYAVLFGVLFAIPMSLVNTQSAATTGLILTTLPVTLAIVAPFAGYSASRWGARIITTVGMVIATVGLVTIGLTGGSLWGLLTGLVILGLGSGLFTPANNASIMASAPLTQAGSASGTLNMTRGLGTAIGVAGATIIVVAAGSGHPSDGLGPAMLVFAAASVLAAAISLAGPRRTASDTGSLPQQ